MREIYNKVSERLGVSEEIVEFVSNHIFSEVRKQLVLPSFPRILLKNFGSFTWNDKQLIKALNKKGSARQEKAWEEKRTIWRSVLAMKGVSSSPEKHLKLEDNEQTNSN